MILLIFIFFFCTFTQDKAQNRRNYHAVITNPHKSYYIKRDGNVIYDNKLLIGDTVHVFGNYLAKLNISCDPFAAIDTLNRENMLIIPKLSEDESFFATIKKFINFLFGSNHRVIDDPLVKASNINKEKSPSSGDVSESVTTEPLPVIVRGNEVKVNKVERHDVISSPKLFTLLPGYNIDFSFFILAPDTLTFYENDKVVFNKDISKSNRLEFQEVENYLGRNNNIKYLLVGSDTAAKKIEINLLSDINISMVNSIISGIDTSNLSDVEKILYKSSYLQLASDRFGDSYNLYWLSYQLLAENEELLASEKTAYDNLIERYKYTLSDN